MRWKRYVTLRAALRAWWRRNFLPWPWMTKARCFALLAERDQTILRLRSDCARAVDVGVETIRENRRLAKAAQRRKRRR